MYPLKFIVKCVLVGGLGIAGILSLSRGFGMPIPFLEYGALEAWNVLVGAALMAMSLCFAFFWHVQRRPVKRDRERDSEWLVAVTTAPKAPRSH
ncbi:MAG TPA: hypothetical protein VGN70_00725 [Gammaproteobacteria bacterium]|jgi:hypothetical protein